MPEAWKAIAEEAPDRFAQVQAKFIRMSHFIPAVNAIAEATGLAFDLMPPAMQEVVFSTAVQHGPGAAARIISRAVTQVGPDKLNPETEKAGILQKNGESLIRRIYDIRSGQFGSSTPDVQTAVKNRLKQEMNVAISMLQTNATA
jgi:lysozyme family protein